MSNEALEAYKTATDRGEIIGYAAMARLASRTSEDEKAEVLWTRFFEELAVSPPPRAPTGTKGFLTTAGGSRPAAPL
jgi:hypothetical protein